VCFPCKELDVFSTLLVFAVLVSRTWTFGQSLEKRDNRTLNSICKNRISDVKYDQNCCRWLKHWTLSNTQPLTYRNPLADVDQGLICLQCPIALFSHDTDHLRLLRRTKNHLLHDFLYIICLNLILFLYKRNNAECIFIYVYTIYIYFGCWT